MFGRFLTTPLGSALRVFVGLVLGAYVASLGEGSGLVPTVDNLETWVGAAVAVALPIIIAAINPADPRFGSKG